MRDLRVVWVVHGDGDLLGHGPQAASQFAGHGDRDHIGMFASCDEASVVSTEPPLRLPPDGLDDLRLVFESQWQMAPDLGGITIRPGAFDQDATGLGVAGLGDRSLATVLPAGMLRGNQAQKLHECPWTLKAGQVPHCGHQGDRHGAWPPPQSLEGLDHRGQTPGVDLLVEGVLQTLAAVVGLAHGSDLVLQNDVLRWRGADDCREPSQVGRAPMSPAPIAASVSEPKGVETKLGIFEIAEGGFPCPGEVVKSFLFALGDLHGGEVPATGQSGELHGISAVRLDPVARFFGEQRRCPHPTVVPFVAQIPVEPGATGTRFRDEDEGFGL
jgi:hypothetical protein